MIKVKVCGLTGVENATRVWDGGADYLGFIAYPASKRYVGDDPGALFNALSGKMRKIGVFVNDKPEKVKAWVKRFGLYGVQLHGEEDPDTCNMISETGAKVIKAFRPGPGFDFSRIDDYRGACDYILFDTPTTHYGGSGLKFQWNMLGDYGSGIPFFLSGGIGPGDIPLIRRLKHESLYAIDINSRFEILPGLKDTGLTDTFIKEIKNMDI